MSDGIGVTNAQQDVGPVTADFKRGQEVRAPIMYSHLKNGRVAQLVEQRTENPRVGGSIPLPATILFVLIISRIENISPVTYQ